MKTLKKLYLIGYILFSSTWAAETPVPSFNDVFNSAQSFLPAQKSIIGIQCFSEEQTASDYKVTYPKPERFAYNLDEISIFKRSTVRGALNLCSALLMRNHVSNHDNIFHEYSLGDQYVFYCIQMHSSVSMCFAHKSYPKGLCYELLQRAHKNYTEDTLQDLLKDYNSSKLKEDKITKVSTGLSELKQVLIDNVDSLMVRQEKLEDLKNQTDALSMQSQAFLDASKRLNRCCIIL